MALTMTLNLHKHSHHLPLGRFISQHRPPFSTSSLDGVLYQVQRPPPPQGRATSGCACSTAILVFTDMEAGLVWDWERRDFTPPRRVGGGPELEDKLEAEGPPASPPQRGSGLPGCPPRRVGEPFGPLALLSSNWRPGLL